MTARLTFRERFFLARKALVGAVSELAPGSAGYDLIHRLYPAVGDPPRRGTLGMLEAYTKSPWVRATCSRIATSVSSVQWMLYAVKPQGASKAIRFKDIQRADRVLRKDAIAQRAQKGELIPVTDHILLDALDSGNPYQTGQTLRKLTQVYLDTVGECFWLKERNDFGKPVAFWPLPPQWVVTTPSIAHPYLKIAARSFIAEIPDTDILWMVDADPVNPYGHGAGPGMAVADEIDTDEAMASTVKQKFYNRARPDIILMPATDRETLSPQDTARLEAEWVNRSQGFWRWFKPFFASRTMQIKELSQDLQALQFVDLRKAERDMIIQVLGGLPPEILGISENSNKATVTASKYLMDTQVVVPRLEFLRSYFQEKLIPEYDERLIIDYVDPVESDAEQQLAAMEAATWAPTVNEWRRFQGLQPILGGDVHMVPINLSPASGFTVTPPSTETPTPGSSVEPPVPQALDEKEKPSTDSPITGVGPADSPADGSPQAELSNGPED